MGAKTAQRLHALGIRPVDDIRRDPEAVARLLGKQGRWIAQLAFGVDDRRVVPYRPEDAKSISREITFQEDAEDAAFLDDVLFLLSLCVERRVKRAGLHGDGVTLKVTYGDMRSISRSRRTDTRDSVMAIYEEAAGMLEKVERRPVRLLGVGLYHLSGEAGRQLTIAEMMEGPREAALRTRLDQLEQRYRLDFAGHLEQLCHGETLRKTVEYMRRHAPKEGR